MTPVIPVTPMPIQASRAPVLSTLDGLSSLERAKRHKLMLGLFLPIQNCGWSASSAPRSTSWHFDYNARLAIRAEELGFDLTFGAATWTSKGGFGGKTRFWETTLDPLLTVAGLAPLTNNLMLISTMHVLYGWHPLQIAKFGATLGHMSGGRWGLNIVTGMVPGEFEKFGLSQIEHDKRYGMADEFTDQMKLLWSSEDNVSIQGAHWRMENAFCTPKPDAGRPILVSAASSPPGIDFAAKHCDVIFVTSTAGADIDAALAVFPEHTARIREKARQYGREIKILVNPLVICRDTEEEVAEVRQRIIDAGDVEAASGFGGKLNAGDQKSFKGHQLEQRFIGGNVQLFGTPAQIVDRCKQLQEAGIDGIHLSFFDFAPDLEHFGQRVLPLLEEAGLREPTQFGHIAARSA